MPLIENTQVFLSQYIEGNVGNIIGPIVSILGFIINILFNAVSALTENNSLGLSIILLTFIIRFLMLPQGFSMQKQSAKMRKIQPELDKIKKKYGDSKDPEIRQKMAQEQQALYAKNKINMLSGCLPLIITMPIFIALNDLIRRLYLYIDKIGVLYEDICRKITEIPGWLETILPLTRAHVQENLWNSFGIVSESGEVLPDFSRLINKFTKTDWDAIKASVTDSRILAELQELLTRKQSIEMFFGLDLKETAGLYWPGIVIPLISAGTSFLLSWLSSKVTPQNDQAAKTNQMVMLVVMPIMMFFLTLNVSGGVGVYWTASNLFAVVQQIVLNKIFLKRMYGDKNEIIGKATEKK